ncbi:anaphase promoting complex subunit protein [Diplodia corticola]|uniref:Anaphase promoting complex subunit protein n=1 Tax=Diplodia corticola TaxID=236234 RepID=A0A1J9R692_9PEZI|nr:anaphase promoting complex subunit protein [Diplodia corticola]OJD35714.1 anaphase promoting complex subunit protein [Diplodia corticola]
MSVNSPHQQHHGTVPTPSPAMDGRTPSEHAPVTHDDSAASAAAAAAAAAAGAAPQHQPSYLHDDNNAAGDAEALSYPPLDDPSSQPLLPPANFSPFFALVADATTGEHHHPAVHYVFSDDDPDLHTAVFMRALGDTTTSAPPSPPTTRHHPPHHLVDDDHQAGHAHGAPGGPPHCYLPPPTPGTKERYVVVDLTPDGHAVAGATSLSRSWQVVGTAIGPAPSFGEDADDDGGGGFSGGGGLMLKVEGTDMGAAGAGNRGGGGGAVQPEVVVDEAVIAAGLAEARRAAGDDLVGGLEELLKRFHGGVDVLDKIVGPDVEVLVQQQRDQQQHQQQHQQQQQHEGGAAGEEGEVPPLVAGEVVDEAPV